MARYVTGRGLGRKICEALGIDPSNVAGVSIDCDVADRALVVVEYYLPEDAAERIVDDLRWYRLVDDEPQEVGGAASGG